MENNIEQKIKGDNNDQSINKTNISNNSVFNVEDNFKTFKIKLLFMLNHL